MQITLAILLMVAVPFSSGWAQDYDEVEEGVVIDYNDEDEEGEFGLPSILTTISEYETLGTLFDLLKRSGLDAKLKGIEPYTVFAPDDSAFAQLSSKQREILKSDMDYLKSVLSLHIIFGEWIRFGNENEILTFKTINDEVIKAEVTKESVLIGNALVIDEEIECGNGVIHVIESVLLPSENKEED
jgi:uncharacterized surface protein with fasciclin (FAS1) repeats